MLAVACGLIIAALLCAFMALYAVTLRTGPFE